VKDGGHLANARQHPQRSAHTTAQHSTTQQSTPAPAAQRPPHSTAQHSTAQHSASTHLAQEQRLHQPRVRLQHRPPQRLPRRAGHLAAEGAIHILTQLQLLLYCCGTIAACRWKGGWQQHGSCKTWLACLMPMLTACCTPGSIKCRYLRQRPSQALAHRRRWASG
jgi:hypothetical protein